MNFHFLIPLLGRIMFVLIYDEWTKGRNLNMYLAAKQPNVDLIKNAWGLSGNRCTMKNV